MTGRRTEQNTRAGIWVGPALVAVVTVVACGSSAAGSAATPSAPVVRGSRVIDTATATFHLSAHESGVAASRLRFGCVLDRGRFHRCAATYRIRVAPGAHVLRVRASDPAGHTGPTTRVSFRRKAAPPPPSPPPPNPVRTIAVGERPVNIAAGAGSVWSSNQGDGTISRIDVASGAVTATIAVGGQPGGVAFGDGSLWVANFGDSTVERVDAASNAVTARIPVGGHPDGAAVATDGSVWISDFAGAVLEIDPATNAVAARIPVPGNPSSPVLAFGLLWIGNVDGSVRTIDPATDALAGAPVALGSDADALAADTSAMWATTFDSGTVALIDPGNRSVVRKGVVPGHASGLVLAGGSVWVSLYDRGQVVQLDPATLAIARRVDVGTEPREIVTAGGFLWVVNELSGTVSRFAP
jgi:YVTN family beta-propeller protein